MKNYLVPSVAEAIVALPHLPLVIILLYSYIMDSTLPDLSDRHFWTTVPTLSLHREYQAFSSCQLAVVKVSACDRYGNPAVASSYKWVWCPQFIQTRERAEWVPCPGALMTLQHTLLWSACTLGLWSLSCYPA